MRFATMPKPPAARRNPSSKISRGHGLELYLAFGALSSSWARARLGDRVTGMTELRQALAAYADQGNKVVAPFFQGRLAEFEAEEQDAEGALARIDEALALAEQTGERWTDALLHRIRGDILSKADPENPARAEDAYRTAIAIAREQGAGSFGLQAALQSGEALPIDRPPGRGARRPRARARRLFADARDAGDRRGAGAARSSRGG